MADRTVSVKLVADAQAYIRGVEEAARKTRESSDQIEQRLAAQREAYQQVGVAALAVGTIAAAGVAAAVNAYSQFDAAMSNVQAATGESAANMQALSDAALTAGADTVFSATEAAAAIEELSKAGVSTADILGGGLTGSLDLAAAGQIAVADAAEIAASTMTQFGLAGDDVTHIADLLAAAAGNAQGGVSDMGAALDQAGLVAGQMGLSVEETTGTLAAFASAGLLGSDAGTSFRAMLLRLANPTGEVRDVMDELGLSFYDAQGQFIGMEGVAGQLQDRMSGLDQETRNAALATIFGQDAIRAASILYTEGAEGVAEWTQTVDDSGYAAEQAAARLDNLQGDLEALGGAFETLLINLGSSADGPLRFLVQTLDDVVSGLANMPEPLQAATIGAAALVAAVGLGAGAFLTIVPQIAATSVALTTLGISAATARVAMSTMATFLGNPYVVATAAAVAGLLILKDQLEATRASAAEWSAVVEGGASAMQLFALANEGINFDSWDLTASNIENVGSYLDLLSERADNAWAALNPANIELDNSGFVTTLGRIDDQLASIAESGDFESVAASFANLVDGLELTDEQAAQLLDTMPQVRDAFIDAYGSAVVAADGSISSADLLTEAYGENASAAEDAAGSVAGLGEEMQTSAEMAQALLDSQSALNDAWFAAQDAMIGYEQSLDEIQAALAEGLAPALDAAGTNFDLSSESGRQAAQMLSGMVTSANEATDAMIANGASAEEVAAFQARAREEIAAVAGQMDATGAVAQTYTGRLNAIPDTIFTRVEVDVAGATSVLQAFVNQRRVAVIEVQAGPTPSIIARNGVATAFAAGGRLPGYAPGYDDRLGFDRAGNVYGLGGGEFVMPTLMTDRYLPILEQMRTGSYGGGFAAGGRLGGGSTYNYGGSTSHVTVSNTTVVAAERDPVIAGRQFGYGIADAMAGGRV